MQTKLLKSQQSLIAEGREIMNTLVQNGHDALYSLTYIITSVT